MKDKKICSGFPEKPGTCSSPATAVVIGTRQHVCDVHAKQAEAKMLRVNHTEKKS